MTSLSQEKFASLHGRLMTILSADSSDDGVNSEVLSESFGEEYPLLVDVINSLLVDNRLQLSKGENDTMWYKLVQEEKAKKLMGLTCGCIPAAAGRPGDTTKAAALPHTPVSNHTAPSANPDDMI